MGPKKGKNKSVKSKSSKSSAPVVDEAEAVGDNGVNDAASATTDSSVSVSAAVSSGETSSDNYSTSVVECSDIFSYVPIRSANLSVKYDSITLGTEGSFEIAAHAAATAPLLSFSSESGALYTMVMTDPDAPSRTNPLYREFIHWVVVNISNGEDISSGETAASYVGPGPPYNSGKHRYYFTLFKQTGSIDVNAASDHFKGRGGLKVETWASANYLGQVLDVRMFESEWDESVDGLHAALGFMPPPEYQSPNQKLSLASKEDHNHESHEHEHEHDSHDSYDHAHSHDHAYDSCCSENEGRSHAHGHDHDETFHVSTEKGVAVLSIFEDGIPPVFRVKFEDWNGDAVSAADVSVTTSRTNEGSLTQEFSFSNLGDFLQSTIDIPEPHEFSATLSIINVGEFKIEFKESHAHGSKDSGDSHDHSEVDCKDKDVANNSHSHNHHELNDSDVKVGGSSGTVDNNDCGKDNLEQGKNMEPVDEELMRKILGLEDIDQLSPEKWEIKSQKEKALDEEAKMKELLGLEVHAEIPTEEKWEIKSEKARALESLDAITASLGDLGLSEADITLMGENTEAWEKKAEKEKNEKEEFDKAALLVERNKELLEIMNNDPTTEKNVDNPPIKSAEEGKSPDSGSKIVEILQSSNSENNNCSSEIESVEDSINESTFTIDKFGFTINLTEHEEKSDFIASLQKTRVLNDTEVQFRKVRSGKREKKWTSMVSNWSFVLNHVIKRRVIKGIPDSFRGQMWFKFLGGDEVRSFFANSIAYKGSDDFKPDHIGININVSLLPVRTVDEINRDIDRTFPRHVYFMENEGPGQKALRSLLQRYAVVDPAVGYCQGMAFIAALLLTYLSEEEAFYTFYAMLQNDKNQLRTLFLPDMLSVKKRLFVFSSLCDIYLPKLMNHFRSFDCGIHPTMYATEWFMTMFCRGFSFDLVTRVIDIFCYCGYKIVYRVAVALLDSVQERLLDASFEGVMKILRVLPTVIDADEVIAKAMTYKFTTRQTEEIMSRYSESAFEKLPSL